MKTKTEKKAAKKKNIADTYNAFKKFGGQQYTGMTIGRSHKWYYDKGVWHDKKITPDKWEISFEVTKRRAGHAPEGSGVPVGTEYHWFILAHQMVKKLNANDYSTAMTGLKYKIAHKRADKDKWNISDNAQRKHIIQALKEMIADLEKPVVEAAEILPPLPVTEKEISPKRAAKKAKTASAYNRTKTPARPSRKKIKTAAK
jgi:hypothetical protein